MPSLIIFESSISTLDLIAYTAFVLRILLLSTLVNLQLLFSDVQIETLSSVVFSITKFA